MRFLHLILLLFFTQIVFANALKYETSPYLLQHDKNPVNWYAWSEKTFALAKKEHKPIYVSIGYSTCHWCHKMAEESFENEEIAKLLNKYFICIKVDKEEMPHIDSKYQVLHKKLNNHPAGWPINIFMSNKKEVFFMSGYIPPYKINEYEGLKTLVPSLYHKYKNHTLDKKIQEIKKLSHDTNEISNIKISKQTLIDSINDNWDELSVGFGGTSKFPEVSKIHLMIDLGMNDKAKEMLNVMAMRGLYDHVDGGFFRYSTDVDWEIPHFEKMLYNQAELIQLYSRAYKLYKYKLNFIAKVEDIQTKISKKGNQFAIVNLMDFHGNIEIMLFADKLKELQAMDLEEPVAFKAKITQTDMFTRIGVSKIMTLNQASKETKKVHKEVREVPQEPIHLAIKLDENTQILDEIYNIVRQNAGNRELKITIISKLQNVVIDSAIRVDSKIIKILEGNTAVDIL